MFSSLRFWRTGFACGSIFNQWRMISRCISIISVCVHANTSWFLRKKLASCCASLLPRPLPILTTQLVSLGPTWTSINPSIGPVVDSSSCKRDQGLSPLAPCLSFLPLGPEVAFLFSQLALVTCCSTYWSPTIFLELAWFLLLWGTLLLGNELKLPPSKLLVMVCVLPH